MHILGESHIPCAVYYISLTYCLKIHWYCQLYPKTCLKILSICCQSSYEGMRRCITGSIAKEFDYFICRTCVTFIETGMLNLLIPANSPVEINSVEFVERGLKTALLQRMNSVNNCYYGINKSPCWSPSIKNIAKISTVILLVNKFNEYPPLFP